MPHPSSRTLLWILFAVLAASACPAVAQEVWRSHTPFRAVTALASSDTDVWAATTGGVFSYSPSTGEVRRFTTTQGLYGIDASAISFDDRRGSVWIGYEDGALDRLDPASGSVETFLDITRADQFSSRRINLLAVAGDTVYASTDFGVVLFDPIAGEVRDSYTVLGTLNPATPVSATIVAPVADGSTGIWAATIAGVAYASFGSVNLREPGAWNVEQAFGQSEPVALAFFDGRIIVGTDQDAYERSADGSWSRLNLSGNRIGQFAVHNGGLFGAASFSVVSLVGGRAGRTFVSYSGNGSPIRYETPSSIVTGPDNSLWLGDFVEGLISLAGLDGSVQQFESSHAIVPEGPFFGLFTDLTFDREGVLWASGSTGEGTGFYRYDGTEWSAFTERFIAELKGRDSFDSIHADREGNVWSGSVGNGLVRVSPDGEVTAFDESNSTLRVAIGTTDFIRVQDVVSESDGTVWALDEFSSTPLNAYTPDGSWSAIPPLRGGGLSSTITYDEIFVDSFDQKWILPLRSSGLIVWDSNKTPGDTGDDRVKFLRGRGSGGRGLPDEVVTAWAEDRSGRVWIGTQRGPAVFFTPGFVISDDPNAFEPSWPIAEDRSGFLLRDLFINDIAVDAADRKWIASRNGVWLVDSEGANVLAHYTRGNSPLFSNEVVAVAADERTGLVYFATDKGLLSLQTDPITPRETAGDLFVFPNPVRARSDGSLPPVLIEGLVEETDIRILAPDGELVASFEARGGRTRWDGRDLEGRNVPSGIYLVVAIGQNDEGTARAKIAVIR